MVCITHACVDDIMLYCVRGCQVTGKNHGKCVASLRIVSLCMLNAGLHLSLDAEEAYPSSILVVTSRSGITKSTMAL